MEQQQQQNQAVTAAADEREFRSRDINSVALDLTSNNLLKELFAKTTSTVQGASTIPGQVIQPPVATQAPNEQPKQTYGNPDNSEISGILASLLDPSATEKKFTEEPVVPVKFNLLQTFEELNKRLKASKETADIDLNLIPEAQRASILKLREDAERGRQVEEAQKRQQIARLQAAIDGWIPSTLAYQRANGIGNSDADALEKYLSLINVHNNPGSQAMFDLIVGASKQHEELQQKRRQDVNESNALFQKAKLIARKLKEVEERDAEKDKRIELLSKKIEELSAAHQLQQQQQQQAIAAQPQYLFGGQPQQPLQMVTGNVQAQAPAAPQYTQVTQNASKFSGPPELDPRSAIFFNAAVLNGAQNSWSLDETLNMAKTTSEIFNQYMLKDADSSDLRAADIYPEIAFKRPRTF